MKTLTLLSLSFIATLFFQPSYAQFYKDETALKKAWPELASESGFWGNSYSTYRYYVGDINDDNLPDIVSVVKTYDSKTDERVIAMEIALSRGKDLFKKINIPRLFPYESYSGDELESVYISDITPAAKGLTFHVRDKTRLGYYRNITVAYNRSNNQLEIVKDGGKGVVSGITEEKYLTKDDFGNHNIEDLTNWDYIDEYIPQCRVEENRKTVTVKTREAFFAALGDHRDIILDMDVLDLSMKNIEKYTSDIGYETGIDSRGVYSYYTDLTIKGKNHVDVIVDNDLDDVFTMAGCKMITFENLNFYHLVPADAYCAGLVVRFMDCNTVIMRNCQFNGSGMVGITLENTKNVTVEDAKIYNNSSQAITINNSKGIRFTNTEIYKNHCESDLLGLYNSEVAFYSCDIHDNYIKERIISPTVNNIPCKISFEDVAFRNNQEKNEAGRNFYFPGDDESTFVLGDEFYKGISGEEQAAANYDVPEITAVSAVVAVPVPADIADAAVDPSVRESLIRNFIASEDERDINSILSFLSPNMKLYWEQAKPTRDYLKKTYASSWKTLSTSSNTILGIKTVAANKFVLHTYFEYTVAQTKKKASKESYVEFIFDNNDKILSIKSTAKP